MAMLAEPRSSRKKWTLNPRGKLWSNDDNKFGQKMLEKMGWSKGKGLGRTEQGETEPIRVTNKSDMKGVGFKDGNDEWLVHKDEFNSILSQLNGTESVEAAEEKVAVKSLETRSKKSKFRVHYHKFTRGKDLSKYSAQDMACILGKRPVPRSDSPPEEPTPPVMEEVKCEGAAEESKDEVDRSNGFVTISKGNIHDYFASKMAALKMKAAAKEESSVPEVNGGPKEDVMEMEAKVEEPAVPECSDVGLVDKKRVRFNEDLNVVNEFSPKMMILAETTDDKKSKKRKKNAEHEESKKKRKIDSEVTREEEVPQKKKKKKKKDVEETVVQEQVQPATESEVVPDQTTEPEAPLMTKKKKKKIEVNEQESAAIEEAPQTLPEIPEPETAAPSKKKKKKSKDKGEETTEVKEAPQTTPAVLAVPEPVTAVPLKKKKKSKGNRKETTAVEEAAPAALEVTVQPNDQAAEPATATPSKKKSKDDGEETTAIEEATPAANEAPVQLEEHFFEPTPSKKKKIKSKGNGEETAAIEETAPASTKVLVLQLEEQVIEPATLTPSKKNKTKSKGNREETAVIEETAPAATEVPVLQLEEQVIEPATPTPSKKKKTKSKGNGEETTVEEAPQAVVVPEPPSDGAAPETTTAAPPKKRKKSKDQQELVAQDPMPPVEQESILTDPAAPSLKKKKRKQDINDQDPLSAMDHEPILATPADPSNSTSNGLSNSTPADPSDSTSTDPSSSTPCDSQPSSGPHRGHHALSKWKSKKKEPRKRKGSKKSKASKMVSSPVKIEPNFSYLDAAPGSEAVKKALKKLESAQFHLFVNSNLHHVTGYGNV